MHGRHGREDVRARRRRRRAPERSSSTTPLRRSPRKLRQVDLREQDVVGAGLRQQRERARIHDRVVGDRPGVERVARGERSSGTRSRDADRELVRKRRERDACGLALVGEQRALAARLGDRRDPDPARGACAVRAPRASRRGRGSRSPRSRPCRRSSAENARAEPTSGAGVRERRAGGRLRASHLQADDRLPGLGRALERQRRTPPAAARSRGRARSPACPRPRRETRARSAASRFTSPPEETTQRKPILRPAGENASPIEPDCATTETCPGRKVAGTVPIQVRRPVRGRDAHAVRAEDSRPGLVDEPA